MTDQIAKPTQMIQILVDPNQPNASLAVRIATAPEKPSPGGISAQIGDVSLVQTGGKPLVAQVSIGKNEKLSAEKFRQAGGGLARWLAKNNADVVDLEFDSVVGFSVPGAPAAFLEGILLASFSFVSHKSKADPQAKINIHLRSNLPDTQLQDWVNRASVVTSAVNLARDWAHEPANVINPITLAARVAELAQEDGIKCSILDDHQLTELGAGGLLSVGKGSQTPSRLIILEYAGQNPAADCKPVVLVGKAITFDTGGYSMKSVENIQGMKYDKCGGMVVIALLHLAAQLKWKNPLVGIIPAAENMISGGAYRPDDIIRTLSGKTVEIISTDAEGRMILADALSYAQSHFQPRALIDLATLTGGVVVALGKVRAGLMANSDELAAQLSTAGDVTYERLWRLPLDEEYVKNIKSDDADIKNSGGREAHAIMGGTFLKQFVDDQVPWAHLDIAGVSNTQTDLPYCPKGATGFGIRLLAYYLESLV